MADPAEIQRRVVLVAVDRLLPRIRNSSAPWIADELRAL